MTKDETDYEFPGFTAPNYTPVPDALFDELLPLLTGSELKVLLYVVRRTFGFKKGSDAISLSQMLTGIASVEGRVLDRGAGIKDKKTLLEAINKLEKKKIILTERQSSTARGNEPTLYRLNVQTAPSEGKIPPPLEGKSPQGVGGETQPSPWGGKPATQETERQKTDFDSSNIRNAKHEKVSVAEESDGVGEQAAKRSPGPASQPRTLATSPARLTKPEQFARRGPSQPVAIGETLKHRRRRAPGTAEDREVIVAYLSDFAREFRDQAPLRVSVSRALNLMNRSGLSREMFTQRMYEARSLTKESYGSIKKTVKTDGSPIPLKSAMAFYFAILEDLLGLRPEDAGSSAQTAQSG